MECVSEWVCVCSPGCVRAYSFGKIEKKQRILETCTIKGATGSSLVLWSVGG